MPVSVRLPPPILVSPPEVPPPKAVASVTALPLVSSRAVWPFVNVSREEMSCVFVPPQRSVPPFMVIEPAVPRDPLRKESVPPLIVVPPVNVLVAVSERRPVPVFTSASGEAPPLATTPVIEVLPAPSIVSVCAPATPPVPPCTAPAK